MPTLRLEDAPQELAELVEHLAPAEALVITRDDRAVARLSAAPPELVRRKAGGVKRMLTIVAEDDEHLDDFANHL